jgi:hypothetical protein
MSRPIHVEESVTVARSPEVVWSAVADYGRDVEWRQDLTEMTPDPPGPPGVGTKVHEVLRTGGRSYVADSTVTGMNRLLRPIIARTARRGLRGDLERLCQLLEQT